MPHRMSPARPFRWMAAGPRCRIKSVQTRLITLTFPDTGESALADLLDAEAPGTCELVWKRLPVEQRAVHGMYSGAEVFALIENPEPAPAENLVQLPLPGELLYFFDSEIGRAHV